MDRQPKPQDEPPRRSFFRLPGRMVQLQLARIMLSVLAVVVVILLLLRFILPGSTVTPTPTVPVTTNVTQTAPSPAATETRPTDDTPTAHPTQTPAPMTPTPHEPQPTIRFTQFRDCPEKSEQLLGMLRERIGGEVEVVVETSEATDQPEQTPDVPENVLLVVSGQCAENGDLNLEIDLFPTRTVPEISDLGHVALMVPDNMNLSDYPLSLVHALIDYSRGNYQSVTPMLRRLADEAKDVDEQHWLTFLLANARLLSSVNENDYRAAIAEYDGLVSESDVSKYVLASTFNNRAIARLNLAVLLPHSDRQTYLDDVELDFEEAAKLATELADTNALHGLVLVNQGTLHAIFEPDSNSLDDAEILCKQARDITNDEIVWALSYICLSIVYFTTIERSDDCSTLDVQPAYEYLDAANIGDVELAMIYFWRAAIAGIQANCNIPQAREMVSHHIGQFQCLIEAQSVKLAVVVWLEDIYINFDYVTETSCS